MCYTRNVYVINKVFQVVRKTIYNEPKNKTTLSLTKTALEWLEREREKLNANSLSDALEKMARKKE
jgi:hypothetical protein